MEEEEKEGERKSKNGKGGTNAELRRRGEEAVVIYSSLKGKTKGGQVK